MRIMITYGRNDPRNIDAIKSAKEVVEMIVANKDATIAVQLPGRQGRLVFARTEGKTVIAEGSFQNLDFRRQS